MVGAYVAKATAIASGGAGRLYRVTTNSVISEGIATAIALEAGVVALGNMEAVQFHPTPIFPSGILLTEGARGDGGLLRDGEGNRFMPDYEPEKKELASRDVVSRRMEEHIAKGKGAKSRFGDHLWLDITLLGEHHIKHNLREVYEICHYFLGVDPVKEWVPVRPAQHYTMGGVRTNHRGESPASTDYFPPVRRLLDMHAFTAWAALCGGDGGRRHDRRRSISPTLRSIGKRRSIRRFDLWSLHREQAKLDALIDGNGRKMPRLLMAEMQQIMTRRSDIPQRQPVGEAVDGLQKLLRRSRNIGLRYKARGANPELVTAYRVQKMLKLALCVAYGALERTESRGAHFREDFPRRNDAEWLKRTLATWKNEADTLPSLSYEQLDVKTMELPPGWRGYGAKDYIDHPDTAARVAEVEELKKNLDGADRSQFNRNLCPMRIFCLSAFAAKTNESMK